MCLLNTSYETQTKYDSWTLPEFIQLMLAYVLMPNKTYLIINNDVFAELLKKASLIWYYCLKFLPSAYTQLLPKQKNPKQICQIPKNEAILISLILLQSIPSIPTQDIDPKPVTQAL